MDVTVDLTTGNSIYISDWTVLFNQDVKYLLFSTILYWVSFSLIFIALSMPEGAELSFYRLCWV